MDYERYGKKLREEYQRRLDACLSENAKLLKEIRVLNEKLNRIQGLVDEQAEDESIWFQSVYITEEYLQLALRELHKVIEE